MERHNYHSYLREGQEGESGELEATWSHFRNWKGDNANPPENHFYFQLGVVADTSYSCAATWMELGKLQNWARRNLMKFNKCFSLAPVQMGGGGVGRGGREVLMAAKRFCRKGTVGPGEQQLVYKKAMCPFGKEGQKG